MSSQGWLNKHTRAYKKTLWSHSSARKAHTHGRGLPPPRSKGQRCRAMRPCHRETHGATRVLVHAQGKTGRVARVCGRPHRAEQRRARLDFEARESSWGLFSPRAPSPPTGKARLAHALSRAPAELVCARPSHPLSGRSAQLCSSDDDDDSSPAVTTDDGQALGAVYCCYHHLPLAHYHSPLQRMREIQLKETS